MKNQLNRTLYARLSPRERALVDDLLGRGPKARKAGRKRAQSHVRSALRKRYVLS